MRVLAPFLASADAGVPDPNGPISIGALVIGVGVLAGIVLTFILIFRRDPPLHREFASKAELDALSGRVDRIAEEIGDRFDQLDEKRSQSIKGLHHDLAATREAVRAEVKADVEKVHLRVNDIFGELKRLSGLLEK